MNKIIRPWKSRLALFYIKKSFINRYKYYFLTIVAIIKDIALKYIYKILKNKCEECLIM